MALPWFRWWIGTVNDPKLDLVAQKCGQEKARVVAVWAALLEAAAAENNGGCYKVSEEEIAVMLRLSPSDVKAILRAMGGKRSLVATGRVLNWEKRQFASDSSTARVRACREKARKQAGNVTEMHMKHMKRNVTCETASEGDTEGDTETEGGGDTRAREATPTPDLPPPHRGDQDHVYGPESAVWQEFIRGLNPDLPRTGNGYCNLREWGLELAKCDHDRAYPLHGDALREVLQCARPSLRTIPRKHLEMLERKYHAQAGEEQREQRKQAHREVTLPPSSHERAVFPPELTEEEKAAAQEASARIRHELVEKGILAPDRPSREELLARQKRVTEPEVLPYCRTPGGANSQPPAAKAGGLRGAQ